MLGKLSNMFSEMCKSNTPTPLLLRSCLVLHRAAYQIYGDDDNISCLAPRGFRVECRQEVEGLLDLS
jgi:hypothetical protein